MSKIFIKSDKKIIIDSAEKAYTLGYLWGDGNLHSYKYKNNITRSNVYYPKLEIKRADLDNVIHLFSVWGNWKTYYRTRPNRKEQGKIQLFDKEFGWFLYQNDYLTKSISEPTKILSVIPKKLQAYWWRGFVDADGCFYVHKKQYLKQFSLAGSFEQRWKEVEKLFNALHIVKYEKRYIENIKLGSRSSNIRICNKNDIIKFGNYIYSNKLTIGLKRKYDIFLNIKS